MVDILENGCYYHIYNRGIDSTDLFKQEKNYGYFLAKYALYLGDYVDTYAYCLLKNHFHLLVRVKEEDRIHPLIDKQKFQREGLHSMEHLISKQFAKLFSSYTQSFNKVYGRTGSLFDTPFKRKRIDSDYYLTRAITYLHQNPQKHGFVKDFREYPHSSYRSFLANKPTKLARKEVIDWFGNEEMYIKNHLIFDALTTDWMIEA